MATQLAPLSACVTRILAVSGFSAELKTRDFQLAFSDWENIQGGFKIKWLNDTSLYIVFQDPTIAKRAYLQALFLPPTILTSPTSAQLPNIKPYDGPDAQNVIQAVNSRGAPHIRGHASRASIAVGGGINGAHARMGSGVNRAAVAMPSFENGGQNISIPPHIGANREPSPTLPNLPTQPTLNSLINSSLSSDHISDDAGAGIESLAGGPRIGEPGKRMVAHQLGVKMPHLNRSSSGGELSARLRELQRGMHGVSVTE